MQTPDWLFKRGKVLESLFRKATSIHEPLGGIEDGRNVNEFVNE